MKTIQTSRSGPSVLFGFCGGLREACWLAAVATVPLLFSPQALNGFDPFRTAWLQILALIMLGTWVVRAGETRTDLQVLAKLGGSSAGKMAAGLLLIFCLGQVLSSVFSVDPLRSFWGSYEFRQGSFTILCYLVIFVSVATGVRSGEQTDRLVTALILPALPLSLYALMQAAGSDPLFGIVHEGRRVTSLAGNPLYLGGHLGITFLFTVWRMHRLALGAGGGSMSRLASLVFYGVVGVLQLWALLLSQSRAALLALAAALLFFALTLAARSNRGWLKGVLALTVSVAVLFALVLVFARGSPGTLARFPLVVRFAGAISGDDSLKTRVDLWTTAAKIATTSAPFTLPSGAPDRWPALRPWLGFGPETVECIFPHYWPFTTIYLSSWAHFHSCFWDQWVSAGAIGTLAFLGLLELAFFAAFRRLGLIVAPRDGGYFWVITLLGSAGLCRLFVFCFGPAFLGIGLVAGLAGAKIFYVVVKRLFLGSGAATGPKSDPGDSLAVVALAALFFHVIETSVLFPVPATAMLFWISLGLAFSLPADPPNDAAVAAGKNVVQNGTPDRGLERGMFIGAGMVALMLVGLCFAVIRLALPVSATGWDILAESLWQQKAGGSNHLLLVVFCPVWLGGAFAFAEAERLRANGRWCMQVFAICLLLSGITATLFAWVKAGQIAALKQGLAALSSGEAVIPAGLGYDQPSLFFFGTYGLILGLLGWCCTAPAPALSRRVSLNTALLAALCLGATGISAWKACINPVLADARAGWAKDLSVFGWPRGAVKAYQDALELDGRPINYRANLAALLLTAAESSTDRPGVEADLRAAEEVLAAGRSISMFDKGTFLLGELYLRWAATTERPAQRRELAQRAGRLFDDVVAFDPYIETALVESSLLNALYLDNRPGAEARLKCADNLASTLCADGNARSFFEYYSGQSASVRQPELKRRYAERALRYYSLVAEAAAKFNQPMFSMNLAKGMLHLGLGELPLALAAFQLAVTEGDPVDGWRAEGMIAQTFAGLGNREAALRHVRAAAASAPARVQPVLAQMRQRLEQAR